MLILLHLKIFIAFSSFPPIIGDVITIPAVDLVNIADGEEYLKKVANGEKISDKHEVLMFTAPYKLCDGGCNDEEVNAMIGFPLYIGKKGIEAYEKIYCKDKEKLYLNANAPFQSKTTRAPYTTVKMYTINIISTVTTPTTPVTINCPSIPPGMCLKKIKPKKNKTKTKLNHKQSNTDMTITATVATVIATDITASDTTDTSLSDDSTDYILTVLNGSHENETNGFNGHEDRSSKDFIETVNGETFTEKNEQPIINKNLLRNIKRKTFYNHFKNPVIAANMKKELNRQVTATTPSVEALETTSESIKVFDDTISSEYLQESVQLESQHDFNVASNTDTYYSYFG